MRNLTELEQNLCYFPIFIEVFCVMNQNNIDKILQMEQIMDNDENDEGGGEGGPHMLADLDSGRYFGSRLCYEVARLSTLPIPNRVRKISPKKFSKGNLSQSVVSNFCCQSFPAVDSVSK